MKFLNWVKDTLSANEVRMYVAGFLFVVFLSVAISGYKLGSVPHGLTWDEAAIGYNGYAVLTTRRDEWLIRLPVSFRSFGDYKAPLAIYTNGVSTWLFGLNAFGIRLPFMVAGVMSVIGIMLLVELMWRDQKNAYLLSVLAGLMMVTTPWYVHYSRAGFESGLALCFTIWGVYFFLLFKKYCTSLPLMLSMLSFVFTLYTYHSSKVVTPLLVIALLFYSKKEVLQKKVLWKLVGSGLLACALCYALIKDSLYGNGLERAGVTLFSQMSFWEASWQSAQQFGLHLSPGFLIHGDTTSLRHGDGNWGVLLLPMYLLILLGLMWFILRWKSILSEHRHILVFAAAWLFIGILPAAIATEVPHSNRALLALPAFIILATLTLSTLLQVHSSVFLKRMVVGGFILFQALFFTAYIIDYFSTFASASADDFKDGYIEAFQIAQQYELGLDGKPQVEKIIFASDYGQPYIFALLVRKTNPILYQGGSLIKYEFKDDISSSDLNKTNTLVVAAANDEMGDARPEYEIQGSDNKTKFRIYLTKFR